ELPWGLAYAVAVQKESVGKGHAVRGLGRPKQGQHPGPSALLKHRTGSPSKADTGAPAFDPFGRTAARVANPVEVAWRSTVAATITEPLPLATAVGANGAGGGGGGGGRQTLAPLPPKPTSTGATTLAAALGPSASQSNSSAARSQVPKSTELMQTVAANLGWGGSPMRLTEVPEVFWKTVSPEVHSQITEYLFEQDYDANKYISAQLQELHARRGTQLHRTSVHVGLEAPNDGRLVGGLLAEPRDPVSPPLSNSSALAAYPPPTASPTVGTPPAAAGAGGNFTLIRSGGGGGGTGGGRSSSRRHSNGHTSVASSVVSFGGAGGGPSSHSRDHSADGSAAVAGGGRSDLVTAAATVAPAMMSKYEEQQMLRSTVALSAVLTADQTGLLGGGNINRGVGAQAYSRWFRPDGTSKWKPCVVTAVSEDGTAFAIEWLHIRKTKTVSRFNILFDGESETALKELRNAALEHQRRLQQQLEFNAARDSVPLSAAPLLTDGMVGGIVRRLGLDYWDTSFPSTSGVVTAAAADGSTTGRGGGSGDGGGGSIDNAAAAAAAAAEVTGHATRSSGGNSWGDEGGEFGTGDLSGGDDGRGGSEDGGDQRDSEPTRSISRNMSSISRFSRISRSAASARAQLQGTSFRSVQSTVSRGGVSTSSNSGGGTANEQDFGPATGNGTASRAPSRGSPPRASSAGMSVAGGQVAGSKRAVAGLAIPARPALRRRLLQWRHIKRAWRRATTDEPVERIRQRLEEARMEYAIAHNRHVFRVMFARMFGSSGVPDQVEELLMDISRTANTDEDDGGLIFIHRPLLQPGRSTSSMNVHDGSSRESLAPSTFGPPPSVFVPCPAAFEEPGDGTPPPGVTAYGIMALGEMSLMAAPPTLRALQQASSYLVNIHVRDIFGLQLLPARHVFAFLAGHNKVAAEHQAFIESCRRPAPTAIISSPLGASVFETRPFRPDDSIDLITFLNIQEGVRIEEIYDIRSRVCQQLAYIIADAADEALQAAVAAAAAAAVAAVERANGKLRTPPGAVPGQAAPWQRQPFPALAPSSSSSMKASGSRLYQLPPTPGTAAAAMVQHAAAQAAFDPVPFFRLTSTLNVELFYSIRMWMLQSLRTYAAALELYSYGGVDTHLYDGVPTEVEQTTTTGEWEQPQPPPPPPLPSNGDHADYSRVSGAGAGIDRSKPATPPSVSPQSPGSVFARRVSTFSSDGGGVNGTNGQPSPTDSSHSSSSRGHSCAPLFRVTLGVVDGEVHFSPPLDTLCQRLVDSVLLAIEAINTLPGLEISLRQIYREAYPGAAKG
ncbi:hypothetical protein Vafri_22076, partial [Volvox africanus]